MTSPRPNKGIVPRLFAVAAPAVVALALAACSDPPMPSFTATATESVPAETVRPTVASSPTPHTPSATTPRPVPSPCPISEWAQGEGITAALDQSQVDPFVGARFPPLSEGVAIEWTSAAYPPDDLSAPVLTVLSVVYDSARMFWIAKDVEGLPGSCPQQEVIAAMSPPALQPDEVVAAMMCTRVEGGRTDTELIAVVPRPTTYALITDIRHLWRADTREGAFYEEPREGVFCYPDLLLSPY